MFLTLALIAAGIGIYLHDGGIGDIPLAQLTLNKIISAVFGTAFILGAVFFAWKSLTSDNLWPWRWRILKRTLFEIQRRNSIGELRGKIQFRQRTNYETEQLEKQLDELLKQKSPY